MIKKGYTALNNNTFTNKKFIVIIASFCCLLWGSAYPGIKAGYNLFNIAGNDIPSKLVFAGYRFTFAGLIVLLIALLYGNKIFNLRKSDVYSLFILGFFQTALQYIFFYIGLSNTTGVNGSILNSTGTFFSVIIAHIIYSDDKINRKKLYGCLLGFSGVMAVNITSSFSGFSLTLIGDGFIIIAAFLFSAASIYGKKISKSLDVMTITGYNLFIGGLILTITGLVPGGRINNFTTASSLLLTYLAVLSAVAFTLWTLLLKYNKVGSITIFNFLIPVFGSILSAIFLGEKIFEIKYILALILVSYGIWLVNSKK